MVIFTKKKHKSGDRRKRHLFLFETIASFLWLACSHCSDPPLPTYTVDLHKKTNGLVMHYLNFSAKIAPISKILIVLGDI